MKKMFYALCIAVSAICATNSAKAAGHAWFKNPGTPVKVEQMRHPFPLLREGADDYYFEAIAANVNAYALSQNITGVTVTSAMIAQAWPSGFFAPVQPEGFMTDGINANGQTEYHYRARRNGEQVYCIDLTSLPGFKDIGPGFIAYLASNQCGNPIQGGVQVNTPAPPPVVPGNVPQPAQVVYQPAPASQPAPVYTAPAQDNSAMWAQVVLAAIQSQQAYAYSNYCVQSNGDMYGYNGGNAWQKIGHCNEWHGGQQQYGNYTSISNVTNNYTNSFNTNSGNTTINHGHGSNNPPTPVLQHGGNPKGGNPIGIGHGGSPTGGPTGGGPITADNGNSLPYNGGSQNTNTTGGGPVLRTANVNGSNNATIQPNRRIEHTSNNGSAYQNATIQPNGRIAHAANNGNPYQDASVQQFIRQQNAQVQQQRGMQPQNASVQQQRVAPQQMQQRGMQPQNQSQRAMQSPFQAQQPMQRPGFSNARPMGSSMMQRSAPSNFGGGGRGNFGGGGMRGRR